MSILKDIKIVFGQYNITTDLQSIDIPISREPVDDTTFNDSTRSFAGGLFNIELSAAGFFASDGTSAIDDIQSANLGTADKLISVGLTDGTENSRAVSFLGLPIEYQPISGTVGDIQGVAFKAMGSGGIKVVNGNVEKAIGNTTASSASTGSQLGALSATQTLHSFVHVISASGTSPTLDVLVESDDNGSFSSATTQITHTQATGATSENLSVAGAVTDDYWRISYTIGGTDTPTFSWFHVIGIE